MDITLTSLDFAAISPLLILVVGSLLLLLHRITSAESTSKKFAFHLHPDRLRSRSLRCLLGPSKH